MKRLKHISIFIVLNLVCVLCFAQREKIDSLQKILPSLKDSARIECLNALSNAHIYYVADSAKIFAYKALEETEKINYKKGMAAGWLNLAWAGGLAGGDLRTMENQCKNAVLLLEQTSDKKQLADAWFSLACALSSQCKFSSSLDAFARAGRLFLQIGDEMDLARMYSYMADDERNMGQYN